MRNRKLAFSLLFILVFTALLSLYNFGLAASSQTFLDHFDDETPGDPPDSDNWFKVTGVTGYVNNSIARFVDADGGTTTIYVMKQPVFNGSTILFNAKLKLSGAVRTAHIGVYNGSWNGNSAQFYIDDWGSDAASRTYRDGAMSESATWSNDETNFWNHTIVLESNRVRFYYNGTLKADETQLPKPAAGGMLWIFTRTYGNDGAFVYADFVQITEDREAMFTHPTMTYLNLSRRPDTAVLQHDWNATSKTLTLKLKGYGSQSSFKVYRPDSFKSYFVEVKLNGTKTTNISFNRAAKEIRVYNQNLGPSSDREHTYTIQFIDPPVWLVDFAFWFMAATGVSLAPLLKIWDRLAKRHKMLPYLAIFLGLMFLFFAVWYLWQWITFTGSHARF